MSYVSNLILKLPVLEDDKIKEINEFFAPKDKFSEHSLVGNGSKAVEPPTWIAAYKGFSVEMFLQHVSSIKWKYPNEVQVFMCDQNEDRYIEYFPWG